MDREANSSEPQLAAPRWKRFISPWAACLPAAVVFAALVAVAPRQFYPGDDIALLPFFQMNEGAPFVSPGLSVALGHLYTHVSAEFPWYGTYLYGVLWLGFAVTWMLLASVWRRLQSRLFAACCLLAAVVSTIFVVNLTFTMVSIVVAGTGIAAFLSAELGRISNPRPVSKAWPLVCGVLLAAGYSVRPKGFEGALVFSLPLMIVTSVLLVRRGVRTAIRPLAASTALLVSPLAMLFSFELAFSDTQYARAAPWSAYNEVRGWLHGFPPYQDLHKRAPQRVLSSGWKLEDAEAFDNFLFFYSEDTFSLEQIKRLEAAGVVPKIGWSHVLSQMWTDWLGAGAASWLFLAIVIAIAWIALQRPASGRPIWLCIAAYLSVYGLLTCFMVCVFRFPQRVSLPAFFVGAVQLLVCTAHILHKHRPRSAAARPRPPSALGWSLGSTCLGLFLLALVQGGGAYVALWPAASSNGLETKLARLHEIEASAPGATALLLPRCSLALADLDPLSRAPLPRKLNLIWTGWVTYSPIFYDAIEEVGVETGAELLPAMCSRDDCYVFAFDYQLPLIAEIYRREYGLAVRFEQGPQTTDGPALFSVHRDESAPPSVASLDGASR